MSLCVGENYFKWNSGKPRSVSPKNTPQCSGAAFRISVCRISRIWPHPSLASSQSPTCSLQLVQQVCKGEIFRSTDGGGECIPIQRSNFRFPYKVHSPVFLVWIIYNKEKDLEVCFKRVRGVATVSVYSQHAPGFSRLTVKAW